MADQFVFRTPSRRRALGPLLGSAIFLALVVGWILALTPPRWTWGSAVVVSVLSLPILYCAVACAVEGVQNWRVGIVVVSESAGLEIPTYFNDLKWAYARLEWSEVDRFYVVDDDESNWIRRFAAAALKTGRHRNLRALRLKINHSTAKGNSTDVDSVVSWLNEQLQNHVMVPDRSQPDPNR